MKRPELLAMAVIGIGLLGCLQVARAATLTVVNAGFEDDNKADGTATNNAFADGWTVDSPTAGPFNPSAGQFSPDGAGFVGNNVAFFVGGSSIHQTLSDTLAPNTTYTLAVDIGHRNDLGMSSYSIQLYAGTTLLARDVIVGDSALLPAAGKWNTNDLSSTFKNPTPKVMYTTSGTLPPGNLKIVLGAPNSDNLQTMMDNVRLTTAAAAPAAPGVIFADGFQTELYSDRFTQSSLSSGSVSDAYHTAVVGGDADSAVIDRGIYFAHASHSGAASVTYTQTTGIALLPSTTYALTMDGLIRNLDSKVGNALTISLLADDNSVLATSTLDLTPFTTNTWHLASTSFVTGAVVSGNLRARFALSDTGNSNTAQTWADNLVLTAVSIPEPAALVLGVMGLTFTALARRRAAA